MKRIIVWLTVLCLWIVPFGLTGTAVDAVGAIPEEVLRPQMSKIEKKLASDDFENSVLDARWVGMERVEQEDGNWIGKVEPNTLATFGLGKMWLEDHIIRLNIKMDYAPDSWVEVADLRFRNENAKGKVMLYQKADKSISRLYFATVGQSPELWYSCDLPVDHPAFLGQWFFLKVEVKDQSVRIYLNQEQTPDIEAEGFTLANAALAFKPFATTLYIDNLIISRAKDLPQETVKPAMDPQRILLAHQEFEEGVPAQESGFASGIMQVEEGENALRLTEPVLTGEILGKDYCVELNVLTNFTDETGAYEAMALTIGVNVDKEGNGYYFDLESDASGASFLNLRRIKDGVQDSSCITSTVGDGPKNHAEASGIWAYVKIEREGNLLQFYFNDKSHPAYTYIDTQPLEGGGGFFVDASGVATCWIDNLLVSASKQTARLQVKNALLTERGAVAEVACLTDEVLTGGVFLATYVGEDFAGLYQKTAEFAPSILDGREFTVTQVAFNAIEAQIDRVEVYVAEHSPLAEPQVNLMCDSRDTNLTVDVNVQEAVGDQLLLLLFPEGADPISQVLDAQILTLDDTGHALYQYQFEQNQPEGTYFVAVYYGNDIMQAETEFQYIRQENVTTFLETLNQALEHEAEFVDLMSTPAAFVYLQHLGVRMKEFSASGSISWSAVQTLLQKKQEVFNNENTGALFNEAITVVLVQTASSAAAIETLFKQYQEIIDLDSESVQQFEEKKEKIAEDVFQGLFRMKSNYSAASELAAGFREQLILSLIYKSNYMDTYDLLVEYQTDLEIDLALLPESKAERNQAMMRLNAVRCDTYEAFRKHYEKEAPKPSGGSSGGATGGSSGGGAGGNGGGGSGSTIRPGDIIGTAQTQVTYAPTEQEIETPLYQDVPQEHWAYEYIQQLSQKGIVQGYEDQYFYPENPLSRAELCKLCSVALNLDTTKPADFVDVTQEDWYFEYIGAAAAAGLVCGTGDGFFRPQDPVSREDLAVVLYRILGEPQDFASLPFEDAEQISDYALQAVEAMTGAGILSGNNGRFEPQRSASRSEAAKMICETLEQMGEKNHDK